MGKSVAVNFRSRIVGEGEVAPDQLLANPGNWRRHPKHQVDALEGLLSEVGWVQRVIVNKRTGYVVDGHARVELALRRSEPAVPVVYVDLTEAEERLVLAAIDPIGGLAETDQAMLDELLDGLTAGNAELDALLDSLRSGDGGTEGLTDPDDVPEVAEAAVSKLGDVWLMGRHRLMCGDSTNEQHVAKLLAGSVVDLICTDPPYCSGGFQESGKSSGSVGTSATHKMVANDTLSTRGYIALLKSAFKNLGASYVYAFTDWRMWVYLFDVCESSGFGARSMIVWDKGTPGMGRGWRAQHELVLWGCKKTPPFDKHAPGVGNVLQAKRTGNIHHTTEKPVEIMADLIANVPFAEVIADPFNGSGTTLIACESKGRTYRGMELDSLYVDVAVKRWQQFTGQHATLEGDGQTFDEIEAERMRSPAAA